MQSQSMSKKQELYREILRWALPQSRNALSQFRQVRRWRMLSQKRQLHLRGSYEVAQFVHNLYGSILEEDFIAHDLWFLDVQARSFIEGNDDRTCYCYSLYAYYVQELFKIVPANLKDQLKWNGPQGDYDWARPRRGDELNGKH